MVTVVCNRTGIEFQAESRRTKNHPRVSSWSNTAFAEGWYKQFETAIATGKEAGFTTIAEFVELFKETQAAAKAQEEIDYAKRITEYRQRQAEASLRAQNPGLYVEKSLGGPGNSDIELDRQAVAQAVRSGTGHASDKTEW